MIAFHLIMIPTCYIVLLIMFFCLKPIISKNNSVLGVTLTKSQIEHERTQGYISSLKKVYNVSFIILALFPMLAFVTKYFSIIVCVYMLWMSLLIFYPFWLFYHYSKKIKILKKEMNWTAPGEEDDKYWYALCFYYKKDGPSLVEPKLGSGLTVNFARPVGKFIAIIGIASLAVIPYASITCVLEEFTPITLSIHNDSLVSEHISTEYTIDIVDINSIELLESLPTMYKMEGTNFTNLDSGYYNIKGYGYCYTCINPLNKCCIVVITDDNTYFLSSSNKDDTIDVYNKLNKLIKTP